LGVCSPAPFLFWLSVVGLPTTSISI
jgi:hypothetical protein